MEQKTIWMHFLHFGISTLLIFSTISCNKKVDYRVRAKYIFINETDSTINYPNGWEEFNVSAKDTLIYETDDDGPEFIDANDYEPPMIGCYPCIIYFGENLCDTFPKEDLNSPLNINNYKSRKLDDRYYEFTFRYNQQMIDSSDICQ